MRKTGLVLRHELSGLVRNKAFIIVTLLFVFLPVILFGFVFKTSSAFVGKPVGYVDKAGIVAEATDGKVVRYADEESANSDFVVKKIAAYYVVPEDYVAEGKLYLYSGSMSSLSRSFLATSEDAIKKALTLGITQSYLPETVRNRVSGEIDVIQINLGPSGEPAPSQGSERADTLGMAFGLAFLLLVTVPSGYFATSLMKEKHNKIAELLLSSVSPLQLFVGKVLGIGIGGLLQIGAVVVGNLVMLGGAAGIMGASGALGTLGGDASSASVSSSGGLGILPQGIMVFALAVFVYFLLGYLLIAMLLTIVSVFSSAEKQANQYQMILFLVLMIPVFSAMMGNVDSNAMAIMSLFPLTAPVAMTMRLAVVSVPAWELVASVALMVLAIGVMLWVALRLFKSGILVSGGGFSLKGFLGRAR